MSVAEDISTGTDAPLGSAPGTGSGWTPICLLASLVPDRGVAALVDGEQVAVFLLSAVADDERPLELRPHAADDSPELHAVGHHDPCSGANVLARGLVGSTGDIVFVASPIHKQRFDLLTGRCLDAEASIPVHDVRVRHGIVLVRLSVL